MLTPNEIQQLEAYYRGQLSEQDTALIEARLAQDPDFQAEWQTYESLWQGFDGLALESLMTQMQTWEQNYTAVEQSQPQQPTSNVRAFTPRMFLRYAAALVLMIGASFAYYAYTDGFSKDFKPEELFANNFTHYKAMDKTLRRGASEAIPPTASVEHSLSGDSEATTAPIKPQPKHLQILESAIRSYNEQKYAQAIANFEQYLALEGVSEKEDILFYLAISYLGNDQNAKAIELFKDLSSKNHSMQSAAQWYLALSLLKDKQVAQAKKILLDIEKDSEHFYHGKAKAMLEKMKAHGLN